MASVLFEQHNDGDMVPSRAFSITLVEELFNGMYSYTLNNSYMKVSLVYNTPKILILLPGATHARVARDMRMQRRETDIMGMEET